MTPLTQLTDAIRELIAGGGATAAQIENLRQLALHTLDHDTTSAEDIRVALREALDTSNRPNAASFATDSGIGASRAPY